MEAIKFTKMHGLGNDFVVIDDREGSLCLGETEAKAIGNRRLGVGFDQLLILETTTKGDADVFMRILNPDGSEAGACGNGTRCVASVIMNETGLSQINVETVAGLLKAEAMADGLIRVDMGRAGLDWQDVPLSKDMNTLELDITSGPLSNPVAVNMGNPHAVFFVADADQVDMGKWAAPVECHEFFPERTNVEVVSIKSANHLRMRVWERGAGVTDACGSGACAAMVAANRRGLSERKATVTLDGGDLTVEWLDNNRVLMTGPVSTSFSGQLDASLWTGDR